MMFLLNMVLHPPQISFISLFFPGFYSYSVTECWKEIILKGFYSLSFCLSLCTIIIQNENRIGADLLWWETPGNERCSLKNRPDIYRKKLSHFTRWKKQLGNSSTCFPSQALFLLSLWSCDIDRNILKDRKNSNRQSLCFSSLILWCISHLSK